LTAAFSILDPTLSQYSGNLGAGLHAEQPQAQVKQDFFATESIVLDNSCPKTAQYREGLPHEYLRFPRDGTFLRVLDKFANALWYFVKPCDVAWFSFIALAHGKSLDPENKYLQEINNLVKFASLRGSNRVVSMVC
jgi:hypothetical protein